MSQLIAYDPDFDEPTSETKKSKNIWNALSPKLAFIAGVLTALTIIFAIGFFLLLNMFLKGNTPASAPTAGQRPPSVATAPIAPVPTEPTVIQLSPVTDKDWARGKNNAKVTVVEFSDLECPFCKRFHPTMKQLIAEYPNDVQWIYRHFPLTSLHSKAPKEAEATECAGELAGQEGFWKYLDRLFEVTPSNNGLDLAQLSQIAQDVGLDRAKFQTCLDSGTYAQKVQEQENQAVAAGAQGTPYSVVVIGDQKIPVSGAVPYEQLKQIVDSALRE